MVWIMLCLLNANTESRMKVWKIATSFFRVVAEASRFVVFFSYESELKLQMQFEYFLSTP